MFDCSLHFLFSLQLQISTHSESLNQAEPANKIVGKVNIDFSEIK